MRAHLWRSCSCACGSILTFRLKPFTMTLLGHQAIPHIMFVPKPVPRKYQTTQSPTDGRGAFCFPSCFFLELVLLGLATFPSSPQPGRSGLGARGGILNFCWEMFGKLAPSPTFPASLGPEVFMLVIGCSWKLLGASSVLRVCEVG